ncbi:MAG: phenylalanine--tRNA ligase subunit beta, partial [Desulfobacca sp.]|uniref:phenylalanine--tRNA ligase subunit beta n=1 Tax=Desulfobacca sp. TaxID=2067990 RepID=UPI00404B3AD9
MRLSINWLRDFVPLPVSPQELAEKLTLAGLEIDALETLTPAFTGVVVARALAVEPHPQADRLQLVLVDDGREQHRVVCGAPNVQAGGLYALAPPGAVLADGKPLKAAKIRGILSDGMLCAEDELGLSDDHSGLLALPPQTPVGADLAEILGLHDVVLDVAVTPNRPDCLSVLGLAREVAALYDVPLHLPQIELIEDPEPVARYAQVTIADPENCPRYTARLVVDLEVRPSPFWLRRRLQVSGLRPINNLVDVTNYVMLEYGQPLHAFDFHCLRQGRIVVRRPGAAETAFTTLDGQSRPLVHETLLICDAEQPVAIAGVMGGLDSEVTTATKQVLIESAYFHPPSIRKTAKRLGLSSESAYRFERGVDPEGVIPALNRAAQLMAALGSGRILRGLLDACPRPLSRPRLTLRLSRTNAVLGTALAKPQVRDLLRRLQMPPSAEEEDTLTVQVPSYRRDLTREIDLIEEVARLHGFGNIPVTLPRVQMWARRPSKEARLREQVRELLAGMGFTEVINYAFQPERFTSQLLGTHEAPPFVRLANPISEEQAVMRVTLLPGLVENMRRNAAHLSRDLKIFELGMVFQPQAGAQLPQETLLLAGL